MKIKTEKLIQTYSGNLDISEKSLEINSDEIFCICIEEKNELINKFLEESLFTKHQRLNFINSKKGKVLYSKEISIFYQDDMKKFNIYSEDSLENFLKTIRSFTQNKKPLLFDNFIIDDDNNLKINNENYCYIDKSKFKNFKIKDGNLTLKDYNNTTYIIKDLIENLSQDLLNFKILQLHFENQKISLNMFTKKTFEHNEYNTPGIISNKIKLKKML